MTERSILKMVAVRAPRPLAVLNSIDYNELSNTEFRGALAGADSVSDVREMANGFLKSDELFTNRYPGALEALVDANSMLYRKASDPIQRNEVEAVINSQPVSIKQQFQDLPQIEASLLDSVLAMMVAPAASSEMRNNAQLASRSFYVMKNVIGGQVVSKAALGAPLILPVLGALAAAQSDIRPSGVGDLLIVREDLLGYEREEIAHVENVMATETRRRIHRTLDRVTETHTTEVETSAETTRDLESTERSELSSEMDRSVSESMSLSLGTSISASYGPVVSVDASADFSYETAKEESSRIASNFTQEVIDKSVTTMTERRKEVTTITILAETEETNSHGFENTAANGDHIIGVYRWLSQRWKAQILNYGRRLMMEFMVPEPAAVWNKSQEQNLEVETIASPPPDFNILPTQITISNYDNYAHTYGASNLTPPPPTTQYINATIDIPESFRGTIGNKEYDVKSKIQTIPLPDGYVATHVHAKVEYGTFVKDKNDEPHKVKVIAGGIRAMNCEDGDGFGDLDSIRDSLEVAVYLYDVTNAVVALKIWCDRTDEHYASWQMENYARLRDANAQAQSAYEADLAGAKNSQSVLQSDMHPDRKRVIEREELKRGALNLLTRQGFEDFDSVSDDNIPAIDVDEAMKEGRFVSFFEQAFEWINMTYLFYPYFWGNKDRWYDRLGLTDSDTDFEAFRRAGSARVQVPVRPGFERAIIFYLATGHIWGGKDAPVIGSPLYVPIVEEIAESKDVSIDDAEEYGDPWEYTVPTSLVVLEQDASAISN